MPTPDPLGRGAYAPVGVLPPTLVIDPQAPPPPRPAPGPGAGPRWMPLDFVVKDDDDFTAGPGDFVPVPKTGLRFWVEKDGPAAFFVQAIFGWTGFPARNDHLGIFVDGVIHPIVQAEAMQAAPGLGLFRIGAPFMWPMNLARGEHQAQVVIRGGNDDGEVKVGLSLPCKVLANPKCPLAFMVLHS